MKSTYKMKAKKPVGQGYKASDRKSLTDLIIITADPYGGDVTGGSSISSSKSKKKMAMGGIVKKPARSARDMRAGAGSGVGRIQKTKIQRGR